MVGVKFIDFQSFKCTHQILKRLSFSLHFTFLEGKVKCLTISFTVFKNDGIWYCFPYIHTIQEKYYQYTVN